MDNETGQKRKINSDNPYIFNKLEILNRKYSDDPKKPLKIRQTPRPFFPPSNKKNNISPKQSESKFLFKQMHCFGIKKIYTFLIKRTFQTDNKSPRKLPKQ